MRRCFAVAAIGPWHSLTPAAWPVLLLCVFAGSVVCDGWAPVVPVVALASAPAPGPSVRNDQPGSCCPPAVVAARLFVSCDCANAAGCGGDWCRSKSACSALGGPPYAGVPGTDCCSVVPGVAACSVVCARMSAYRVVKSLTLCASSLNDVLAVVFACVSSSGFVSPAIAHAQRPVVGAAWSSTL